MLFLSSLHAWSSLRSDEKSFSERSPTSQLRPLIRSSQLFVSTNAGLSKGSLISLTSSRSTSINTVMGPSSGPPSASSLTSILSITNENRSSLAPARPKCNSILHLFGEWLFEAAHIGSDMWLQSLKSLFISRVNYEFLIKPTNLQNKQLKPVVDRVQ